MKNQTEEQDLAFLEAMKDVRQIKSDDKVTLPSSQNTLAQQLKRRSLERDIELQNNHLSLELNTAVEPLDMLAYKKDGVQEGVFKKLRLGKYPVNKVVNLQNMKLAEAREYLFDTIKSSRANGTRLLLIKHGIGMHNKPVPAYLKSFVNQWLKDLPDVLAFHSASTFHGGLGSVYVLIKKSNEDKLANKELHRKK